MKIHELNQNQIEKLSANFEQHLLPAKLAFEGSAGEANGQLIASYVIGRDLDYSVENLLKAARALESALTWTVAPVRTVVPPPAPAAPAAALAVKSEAEILGERLLAEQTREWKQRLTSDRGRHNHATDQTTENLKKQHEAQKALEDAAQREAEHTIRKMIAEASPVYVGGRLSVTRTEEQARRWEQKLVKKQHMSANGKTFVYTIDWVESIPVIADAIEPDRKNIRQNRYAQRF